MTTKDKLAVAKRILILGYGVEGKSTHRYLQAHYPNSEIIIADKQDQGEKYLTAIPKIDVVFKTPGIPPLELTLFKKHHPDVYWTSQTQMFLEQVRQRVIGVTGTKGKSTTSSLIHHILGRYIRHIVLVGNIGTPFLDVLDKDTVDTWYVAELSCHQLSDSTVSPHIAVILNIYREHLDYYGTYEAYCQAKYNITRFQTHQDRFIYSKDQPELLPLFSQSLAKQEIFSVQSSDIKGWRTVSTNSNNVLASALVAKHFGLSHEEITRGIETFHPLEYRLEHIGTFKGIIFVDDALATIPEATILALEQFKGKIRTLIAGGYDRGQHYQHLADKIVEVGIQHVILFPTTGAVLQKEIEKVDAAKTVQCYPVETMEQAVITAYKVTPKGSMCLLSPAASSFTLFKNYKDRSDQFRKFVKQRGVV